MDEEEKMKHEELKKEILLQIIFDEDQYPKYRESCKYVNLPDNDYIAEAIEIEMKRYNQFLEEWSSICQLCDNLSTWVLGREQTQ